LFIMYTGRPPFMKAVTTDAFYKALATKNYKIFWEAHSRS
jgi:hypothetical protein